MATRLKTKKAKARRDANSAHKKNPAPRAHKIDRERSRTHRIWAANKW